MARLVEARRDGLLLRAREVSRAADLHSAEDLAAAASYLERFGDDADAAAARRARRALQVERRWAAARSILLCGAIGLVTGLGFFALLIFHA